MRTLVAATVIALGSFAATVPASAVMIDFGNREVGTVEGPLSYPDAEFSSSTGRIYVGAAGGDRAICPLNGSHCVATLSVSFASPVDRLMFQADGDNSSATSVFVTGIASGQAFSFAASGFDGVLRTFTPIDLSAFSAITRIDITNNDPAGLGYDYFSFDTRLASSPGTGAVPEPAAWALMLTGFGLVGSAMRRRSRGPAIAA